MKLKLDLEITRKPDPPGFVCSLCDQPKEYWQAMYEGGDIKICSQCRLAHLQGWGQLYGGLSWKDQNTIHVARALLKTLKAEIDDGKRYANTVGQTGPRDADCGPARGFEGPESGQDFNSRSACEGGTGPTSSPRCSLRRHGPKIPRWSRIAAADVAALNIQQGTK